MNEFKVGDTVLCIRLFLTSKFHPKIGNVYIVERISVHGGGIAIKGFGDDRFFSVNGFTNEECQIPFNFEN